jgi:large subunit ribosomal protein L23
MGIFDRNKKTAASTTDEVKPKKAPAKAKIAEAKEGTVVALPKVVGGTSSRLLVSPRVSEKAAMLAGKGTYVFNVPISANKVEIRKAVEALYKVHVVTVHMMRGKGKVVSRGRVMGRRNDWKKALVTLKAGEKLDLYAGV